MLVDVSKLSNNPLNFPLTIKTLFILPEGDVLYSRFRIFDLSSPFSSPLIVIVSGADFRLITFGLYYPKGLQVILDEIVNGKLLFDIDTDEVNINKLRVFTPDKINLGGLIAQTTIGMNEASLIRYGRLISLKWYNGDIKNGVVANDTLVSVDIPVGSKGYIYGFYATCGDANNVYINWISNGDPYKILIQFPTGGVVSYDSMIPLNEDNPADSNSSISLTVEKVGAGLYQGRLLIGII